MTVKANQPKLLTQLRALPWQQVPVADHTSGKAHGRQEGRSLKLTAVSAGISFPDARLALQITDAPPPSRLAPLAERNRGTCPGRQEPLTVDELLDRNDDHP